MSRPSAPRQQEPGTSPNQDRVDCDPITHGQDNSPRIRAGWYPTNKSNMFIPQKSFTKVYSPKSRPPGHPRPTLLIGGSKVGLGRHVWPRDCHSSIFVAPHGQWHTEFDDLPIIATVSFHAANSWIAHLDPFSIIYIVRYLLNMLNSLIKYYQGNIKKTIHHFWRPSNASASFTEHWSETFLWRGGAKVFWRSMGPKSWVVPRSYWAIHAFLSPNLVRFAVCFRFHLSWE